METLRIEKVKDGLAYISFVGTAEALAETDGREVFVTHAQGDRRI